jgi:hypothetical protein
MSQSSIKPAIILNELNSSGVRNLLDHLDVFLKYLEEKIDPDPIEIQIVDTAYQAIEKIQLLEAALRKYQAEGGQELLGNKLDDLYSSEPKNTGTSRLFKD